MSIESQDDPHAPRKPFVYARDDEDVFFCRYCGEHVFFPRGKPGKRCPTPGCTRPMGFGREMPRGG